MKFLISGLGNPGQEYAQTRHNIGFMVIDRLAGQLELQWEDRRLGWVAQGRIKNKQVYLLKPSTYMNLSGKAVRYWLNELKIPLENLLVVTDDLALPTGKIRLRGKGSDGGHNGLSDIQNVLGTTEYPRLRFGISSEFSRGRQVDYVLSDFSPEEIADVDPAIEKSVEAIKSFVLQGLPRTMSEFN
ncbi:MAG: aminoacyl-tRNA hydrolase [Bacteroidia bacterium]